VLSANLYNFRCVILLLQDRLLVLCDRIFTRTIASPNSVQPLTRPRHSIQFNCGTIVSLQQPLCHLSQFYLYAIAASQKRSQRPIQLYLYAIAFSNGCDRATRSRPITQRLHLYKTDRATQSSSITGERIDKSL